MDFFSFKGAKFPPFFLPKSAGSNGGVLLMSEQCPPQTPRFTVTWVKVEIGIPDAKNGSCHPGGNYCILGGG